MFGNAGDRFRVVLVARCFASGKADDEGFPHFVIEYLAGHDILGGEQWLKDKDGLRNEAAIRGLLLALRKAGTP